MFGEEDEGTAEGADIGAAALAEEQLGLGLQLGLGYSVEQKDNGMDNSFD